jgi:hypothetical protein
MSNEGTAATLAPIIVPFVGRAAAVVPQQELIWQLLPETKQTARHVVVTCQQTQAAGAFHSRPKDDQWLPEQLKANLALLRRLHRSAFGRSDRCTTGGKTAVTSQGGKKRTVSEMAQVVKQLQGDGTIDSEEPIEKRVRLAESVTDVVIDNELPDPQAVGDASKARPAQSNTVSESDTESQRSLAGARLRDSEHIDGHSDCDMDTASESSESAPTIWTSVKEQELNNAFAKIRSWKRQAQVATSQAQPVSQRERVDTYLVLLRAYYDVLPMCKLASEAWKELRCLETWDTERGIFGSNFEYLLVSLALPDKRAKEVFQELIHAGLLQRRAERWSDGYRFSEEWRWHLSGETPFAKRVRSAIRHQLEMDCPMCGTLGADPSSNDSCSHPCGDFVTEIEHPDLRKVRRRRQSILLKYMGSPAHLRVLRAVTAAEEFVNARFHLLYNPKTYYYDDYRLAEQRHPTFSLLTGKQLTPEYLDTRLERIGTKLHHKVDEGRDDWIRHTAVEILGSQGEFGFLPPESSLEILNPWIEYPPPAVLNKGLDECSQMKQSIIKLLSATYAKEAAHYRSK